MKPAARPSKLQAKPALDLRLGSFFLWLLVLAAPFALASVAKESFREPKRLAGEWLALASLTGFAWGLRRVAAVRPAEVWRLPAVRLVVPCLAVAAAGLAASPHPLQVREALLDLWIGAAALVGWSLALPAERLERLLRGLLWPASAMALVGILQYLGFHPLALAGSQPGSRLAITSLAGNPGDLAAYLVLPCLVAQLSLGRRLRSGEPWSRPAVWGTALALALALYAMLLTQTLAAVAAVFLGSLLLWAPRVPRRRAVALLAGSLAAAALLTAGVAPLRQRVMEKAQALADGNWNWLLTGRLDGWRTAAWMLREHPLAGVGQGAYQAEFAPAKLALLDQGVPFFAGLRETGFANAHNELLEAGAEWGVPGLLALAWALWVLLAALIRDGRDGRAGRPPEERALAWAGTAALGVLALVDFPFHIALVAFPALLFLSWVLSGEEREEGGTGGIKGRTLAAVLTLLLALATAGQTVRWWNRSTASRLLAEVEALSLEAARSGQVPAGLIASNLQALRRAAPLDPVEVGIPIARGSQYLLLSRAEPAIAAYEEALALEPRSEGYLDLGRAQWLAGRTGEARRSFRLAVRLDPHLAALVPAGGSPEGQ